MLSYESMTERQRQLYDRVKNASGTLLLDPYHANDPNLLGDAEAQAIAEALKVNTTLIVLKLDQNQIGDAGAQAMAEALKVNTTVVWLDLNENQIGDAGAQAIAEVLKVNKTWTDIRLWQNQIGDAGAQAMAEALKVNKTVKKLILSQNRIGDAGAQAIAEALKVNTKLTEELNLSSNQIGDAGAQALAEALKVNKTLTGLYLDYNQIGNAGAKAIAKALKVNKTVKEICLFYNCIDKRVFRAVYEIRNGKCSSENFINCQINPLAFSLLPRFASVEDIQEVFRMLTSGLELENQPASLPALPTEIAELIMDEAQYWQSAQHTKRENFHLDDPRWIMKVTVPQGNSIRVKAIQVLRDWSERPDNSDDCVFDLTVQDEQGDVQYECAVHPTFVKSNLALATIWPASHPILRQMREGWQVQVRASKFSLDVLFESLYVGYV